MEALLGKTKALQAELKKYIKDIDRYRFHAAYGDYTQEVCDVIRKTKRYYSINKA